MLSNQKNWSIWYIELYMYVCVCVCCGSLSFVNAHAFAQQNIYGIIKKNFVLILELSTLSKIQQHCFIVHSAIQCWFLIAFSLCRSPFFILFFSRPSSMCCSDSIVFLSWISFFFLQNKQLYDVFRISIILLTGICSTSESMIRSVSFNQPSKRLWQLENDFFLSFCYNKMKRAKFL